MALAKTLVQARKVLDPRPLDFTATAPAGSAVASDRSFYAPLPAQTDGNIRLPGPIEKLQQQLLTCGPDAKLFLCGHVGSGKSTELSRLAVDPRLTRQFSVTTLRFEQQEWATLDSIQVRFRVAAELFSTYHARLANGGKWEKLLRQLSSAIFQQVGVTAPEGSTSLELNVFFLKLRQELKLSDKARKSFRDFGETQRSVLQDFVQALVDDITDSLYREEDGPTELLLIVDDLDKVRQPDQQRDIFETNLNSLLALPLRIVFTLPTGVSFGENRVDIRQNLYHLFPVRVLKKAPGETEPERACLEDRLGFFRTLLHQRIDPALIDDAAIRLGAIHSGGVLREFLRLLREGVNLADFNSLTVLDGVTMRSAIEEVRRLESMGLYAPDYDALAYVHQNNELLQASDRRYLDQARVIECFNGAVWFEANPLLWPLIGEHTRRKNAQPPPSPAPPAAGG